MKNKEAAESREPIEVTAEVIEPSKDLEVNYTQAIIKDNLAAIEAYVDKQLEPYIGTVIDANDGEKVSDGRKFMADLNKLKEPIEVERKRIKNEYEAPLKSFETRVKGITGKIDAARDEIKKQVDAADEAFRNERRAALEEDYAGCVGPIAAFISFDSIADGESEWFRRSVTEASACKRMEEKAAKAVEGYEALRGKQLSHRDEVVGHYCRTLDLVAALKLEDDLAERDRKMEELRAAQEAAQKVKDGRAAQEQTRAAEGAAENAEPAHRWVLHIEFDAPVSTAKALKTALNGLGISGGTIKDMGVVEDE